MVSPCYSAKSLNAAVEGRGPARQVPDTVDLRVEGDRGPRGRRPAGGRGPRGDSRARMSGTRSEDAQTPTTEQRPEGQAGPSWGEQRRRGATARPAGLGHSGRARTQPYPSAPPPPGASRTPPHRRPASLPARATAGSEPARTAARPAPVGRAAAVGRPAAAVRRPVGRPAPVERPAGAGLGPGPGSPRRATPRVGPAAEPGSSRCARWRSARSYDGAFQAIRTNPRTMIGVSAIVV